MVILEDASNNYDASTLRTLSIEYNRILQITQIFSKLHIMDGKYKTMTQICNLMIVPCNQLLHMVIVNGATNSFDAFQLRTDVSMEYKRILSRIYQQYSQIYTNWDDNRLPCHQYVPRRFLFHGIILS
jgi:hypothetical protein